MDITEVWRLVNDGQSYNNSVDYYKTVDENLAYIMGDQWRGVVTNGLPTPVFNIIKRVRDYKTSAIMSQKIKGQFNLENVDPQTQDPNEQALLPLIEIINNFVELKWDKEKMDSKLRECLQDGFATGDFCIYTYWDANKETGQSAKGDFCCEVIDGVNVLFGNPNNREVEKQPYIILLGRELVKTLQKEAEQLGLNKAEIDKIVPDADTTYTAGDMGKRELDKKGGLSGKCTYAIKLWKEDGRVYFTKSTKHCEIKSKVDMQIKRYPVTFGNWEKVKNCYHGRAECTGIIPNQRYINKQFSMLMVWMMFNAMGKVAYDSTRIPSWTNQIGVAVPVNGDITGAIQQIPAGNFNGGVLELVNMAMKETMNAIGVNDVVLGDVKPDNTSAIIAVQKQSAVPLENVQANLYQFVEDLYLVWAEFIVAMYTTDRTLPQQQGEEVTCANFNSTGLQDKLMSVKVDIGPSSYWSEITSMQTLDALLKANYINMIQYLERIPNGIIPKKQELLEELKAQMEQQAQMQQQQDAMAQQQGAMAQQQQGQADAQNAQYEQMAQFVESLPQELQDHLKSMPPDEMEAAVKEYMAQNGHFNSPEAGEGDKVQQLSDIIQKQQAEIDQIKKEMEIVNQLKEVGL